MPPSIGTPPIGRLASNHQLERRASLASTLSSRPSSCNLHAPRTRTTDDSTLISLEVRTLIGTTFSLIAFTTDTISHLKSQILFEQSCAQNNQESNLLWSLANPQDSIVIVYKGTTLVDDEAKLADYGIHADTYIDIFPKLRAGPGLNAAESIGKFTQQDFTDENTPPGTIVVLCNQDNELFVLEVQLRNRQGQPKILRSMNGIEKTYIDLTMSAWTAEQISDALLRGGNLLQALLAEVQRVEGPLLGLEQLASSEPPADINHSRPSSGGVAIDESFKPASSFTSYLNSIGGSGDMNLHFSRRSSESILALDLDDLKLSHSSREAIVASRTSSSDSMQSRDSVTSRSILPPIASTRNRPVTAHRQRNRTVGDPCELSPHEISMNNIPLLASTTYSQKSLLPAIPKGSDLHAADNSPENNSLPRPISPPICKLCNKKLRIGLSSIRCKCGMRFCSDHKAENKHGCTWDWKGNGKEVLRLQLQPCVGEKVLGI